MRELVKNFFVFGFATMTERVLSIILLPLYARIFSVEAYGTIDIIQTLVAMASIFAFLQLETALQRYYYEYRNNERKSFVYTILATIFLFSIAISALLLVLSPYIESLLIKSTIYTKALTLAIFQIPLNLLLTMILIVLRFEKQNKKFTCLILFKVTLFFLLVYTFIVTFNWGVQGLFLAQFISTFLVVIASIFQCRNYIQVNYKKLYMKKAMQYALPQFPARIGSSVNTYANRFFIVGYLTVYSLGVFSMALKIASLIQIIHQIFMMAWNQFMFKIINQEGYQKKIVNVFNILLPIIFFGALFLSLLSSEIINLFTTPEYLEAQKYIGGLSLAISLIICKEIVDIGPKVKEKTFILTKNFTISMLANLILLAILLPLFSIKGVVYAMISSNLLLVIVSWYNSNKILYIPFSVTYFILTLSPPLFFSTLGMYITIAFSIRVIILIVSTLFYGTLIYKSYRRFK
ncbi:MAG: lipopolysaccharide biosynthesis protein [Phocaeicola sp.]